MGSPEVLEAMLRSKTTPITTIVFKHQEVLHRLLHYAANDPSVGKTLTQLLYTRDARGNEQHPAHLMQNFSGEQHQYQHRRCSSSSRIITEMDCQEFIGKLRAQLLQLRVQRSFKHDFVLEKEKSALKALCREFCTQWELPHVFRCLWEAVGTRRPAQAMPHCTISRKVSWLSEDATIISRARRILYAVVPVDESGRRFVQGYIRGDSDDTSHGFMEPSPGADNTVEESVDCDIVEGRCSKLSGCSYPDRDPDERIPSSTTPLVDSGNVLPLLALAEALGASSVVNTCLNFIAGSQDEVADASAKKFGTIPEVIDWPSSVARLLAERSQATNRISTRRKITLPESSGRQIRGPYEPLQMSFTQDKTYFVAGGSTKDACANDEGFTDDEPRAATAVRGSEARYSPCTAPPFKSRNHLERKAHAKGQGHIYHKASNKGNGMTNREKDTHGGKPPAGEDFEDNDVDNVKPTCGSALHPSQGHAAIGQGGRHQEVKQAIPPERTDFKLPQTADFQRWLSDPPPPPLPPQPLRHTGTSNEDGPVHRTKDAGPVSITSAVWQQQRSIKMAEGVRVLDQERNDRLWTIKARTSTSSDGWLQSGRGLISAHQGMCGERYSDGCTSSDQMSERFFAGDERDKQRDGTLDNIANADEKGGTRRCRICHIGPCSCQPRSSTEALKSQTRSSSRIQNLETDPGTTRAGDGIPAEVVDPTQMGSHILDVQKRHNDAGVLDGFSDCPLPAVSVSSQMLGRSPRRLILRPDEAVETMLAAREEEKRCIQSRKRALQRLRIERLRRERETAEAKARTEEQRDERCRRRAEKIANVVARRCGAMDGLENCGRRNIDAPSFDQKRRTVGEKGAVHREDLRAPNGVAFVAACPGQKGNATVKLSQADFSERRAASSQPHRTHASTTARKGGNEQMPARCEGATNEEALARKPLTVKPTQLNVDRCTRNAWSTTAEVHERKDQRGVSFDLPPHTSASSNRLYGKAVAQQREVLRASAGGMIFGKDEGTTADGKTTQQRDSRGVEDVHSCVRDNSSSASPRHLVVRIDTLYALPSRRHYFERQEGMVGLGEVADWCARGDRNYRDANLGQMYLVLEAGRMRHQTAVQYPTAVATKGCKTRDTYYEDDVCWAFRETMVFHSARKGADAQQTTTFKILAYLRTCDRTQRVRSPSLPSASNARSSWAETDRGSFVNDDRLVGSASLSFGGDKWSSAGQHGTAECTFFRPTEIPLLSVINGVTMGWLGVGVCR